MADYSVAKQEYDRLARAEARTVSSAEERLVDIEEVRGSTPLSSTIEEILAEHKISKFDTGDCAAANEGLYCCLDEEHHVGAAIRAVPVGDVYIRATLQNTEPDENNIKRMTIKEFKDFGYLHELNRRFLHPLGLALEAVPVSCLDCGGYGTVNSLNYDEPCTSCDGTGTTGEYDLGGVWDYRDDPEGMNYGEDTLDPEKARRISDVMLERRPARQFALGYWIQPWIKF